MRNGVPPLGNLLRGEYWEEECTEGAADLRRSKPKRGRKLLGRGRRSVMDTRNKDAISLST